MANTTNYNWETPDDTDLVKDGAAAIRTLGSSVDTTTKALNPSTTLGDIEYRSATANTNTRLAIGTTGQVLTVAGGVPTWATSDDANAIQNAIVDAKGDLIAASAADTPARLAVGANGTVLTADSAETTGLKWAAPAGGSSTYVGCAIFNSGNLTINNETATIVLCDSEQYDTDGFHSTSTNTGRMTIPAGKAGKYQLTAQVKWTGDLTSFNWLQVNLNGTAIDSNGVDSGIFALLKGATSDFFAGSITLDLAVADYVEVLAYQSTGSSKTIKKFRASLDYLGA